MRSGRTGRAAVLALAIVALAGCETTAEKSARLAKLSRNLLGNQRGLIVTATDPAIKVVSTAVLQDSNGAAAVVTLHNTSGRLLVNIPIAITVRDRQGAVLFRNDAPGLERSLVSLSALPPHAVVSWVDDQVQATGTPASVSARVGRATPASVVPAVSLSSAALFNDPYSGVEAQGQITSHSPVIQTNLAVFVVARRGGRVVAAGRAIIPRLLPAKPTPFHAFFIGNPQGAQLDTAAPPTTLG